MLTTRDGVGGGEGGQPGGAQPADVEMMSEVEGSTGGDGMTEAERKQSSAQFARRTALKNQVLRRARSTSEMPFAETKPTSRSELRRPRPAKRTPAPSTARACMRPRGWPSFCAGSIVVSVYGFSLAGVPISQISVEERPEAGGHLAGATRQVGLFCSGDPRSAIVEAGDSRSEVCRS